MLSCDILSTFHLKLFYVVDFPSSCSKVEQKINIPIGKLLKEIRNLNEKREEEVRKLQEKLDQVKVWYMFVLNVNLFYTCTYGSMFKWYTCRRN